MRQIKFRAWDTDRKMIREVKRLYFEDAGYSVEFVADGTVYGDLFPLMQFTGLLDKNGKEIYESDIVKFRVWSDTFERHIIEFSHGAFVIKAGYGEYYGAKELEADRLEVIGSIYENPELLK